jgi:hypothetical protein
VEPINTEVNVPATSPADGQPSTAIAIEQPVMASVIQEPLGEGMEVGEVLLLSTAPPRGRDVEEGTFARIGSLPHEGLPSR